jgi:hypothetical protein
MWQKKLMKKRVQNRETVSTSQNGVVASIEARRNRPDCVGETLVVSSGFPPDPLLCRRRAASRSRSAAPARGRLIAPSPPRRILAHKAQLRHAAAWLLRRRRAASSRTKNSSGTHPPDCSVAAAPHPRVRSATPSCLHPPPWTFRARSPLSRALDSLVLPPPLH